MLSQCPDPIHQERSEETGRCRIKKGYRRVHSPSSPKRPLTGYMRWVDEHRSEYRGRKGMKEAGKNWKDLPSEERGEYNQRYKKQMGQYSEKKAKWQTEHPNQSLYVYEEKPKRGPNAYNLFTRQYSKDHASELKGLSIGARAKIITKAYHQSKV